MKTYALEGNRDDLAPHKGHRVEITGMLAPPASSGANDPAAREFKTGVQRLRVQTRQDDGGELQIATSL